MDCEIDMHIRLSKCEPGRRYLFKFKIGDRVSFGPHEGEISEGFLDGENSQGPFRITYRVQTEDGLVAIQEERLIAAT